MYDFCVIITTFNRPDMLTSLLKNIELEKKHYKIKTFIFNDGSSKKYELSNFDVKELKFYPNRGKKKYWEIVNQTFNVIKAVKSRYYIYLPDDVILIENFFDEFIKIYGSIKDTKKICLNVLTDSRINKPNWTNFKPETYGEYVKTQWNDLCFGAPENFFKLLNYEIKPIPMSRWDKDSNLSSGVGQQISNRIYDLGFNMYHTKKSLVYHGDHNSVMNENERKKNKLITN